MACTATCTGSATTIAEGGNAGAACAGLASDAGMRHWRDHRRLCHSLHDHSLRRSGFSLHRSFLNHNLCSNSFSRFDHGAGCFFDHECLRHDRFNHNRFDFSRFDQRRFKHRSFNRSHFYRLRWHNLRCSHINHGGFRRARHLIAATTTATTARAGFAFAFLHTVPDGMPLSIMA